MATYEVRPLDSSEAGEATALWNTLSGGGFDDVMMRKIRHCLVMTGSSDYTAMVLEADEKMIGLASLRIASNPIYGKRGEIEAFLLPASVPPKAIKELVQRSVQWLQDRDCREVVYLSSAGGTPDVFQELGFASSVTRWSLSS